MLEAVVLVLLAAAFKACYAECPSLLREDALQASSGTWHCDSAIPGQKCKLACAATHVRTGGDAIRQCQSNLIWSARPIECTPYCPDLLSDENSTHVAFVAGECSASYFGLADCTLACADPSSYRPVVGGQSTRSCELSGIWSGAAFACEQIPSCPDLTAELAASNAHASGGECAAALSPVVPGGAKVTCQTRCNEPSYRYLRGARSRACTFEGTWSASSIECEPTPSCSDLTAELELEHASPSGGECAAALAPRSHGGTGGQCKATCDSPAYRRSGGDAVRSCEWSGDWSGTALKCESTPYCTDLTDILAAEHAVSVHAGGACSGGFTSVAGLTCEAQCEPGYRYLSGERSRVCDSSGSWTGKPLRCEPKPKCANLTLSMNYSLPSVGSVRRCEAAYVGETCTAVCVAGYRRLRGDTNRICLDDTFVPTSAPSPVPTPPTSSPSTAPTFSPSMAPSTTPSATPTTAPSAAPSTVPSAAPVAPYHAVRYFDSNASVAAANPLRGFMAAWPQNHSQDFGIPSSVYTLDLPLNVIFNNSLSEISSGFDGNLEPILDEMASRAVHAVLNFFLEVPCHPDECPSSGVPQYLVDGGLNMTGMTPDYANENLLGALEAFISALGQRYDGDVRVGFVRVGLLGAFGSWGADIPGSSKDRVMDAYGSAFNVTQLLVTNALPSALDQGLYHGSFARNTLDGAANGGVVDGTFFWPTMVSNDFDDAWRTVAVVGKIAGPLQEIIFDGESYPAGTEKHQDFALCVQVTHVSLLGNRFAFDEGGYGSTNRPNGTLARAQAGALSLGYRFFVRSVEAFEDGGALSAQSATVVVNITNEGVAPFYHPLALSLSCEADSTTRLLAAGVESVLPAANGTFMFEGVPVTTTCLQDVTLALVSNITYADRPIRFAQNGGDGEHGLAIDLSVPANAPTGAPTFEPTAPSSAPTVVPSDTPTEAPTSTPTELPTLMPTESPSDPTWAPSHAPTLLKTASFGGTPLECEPIPPCPNLTTTLATWHAAAVDEDCGSMPMPGSSCTARCLEGYEYLSGDAKRLCTYDGTWGGDDLRCVRLPSCNASHLGPLAALAMGNCSAGALKGTYCRATCVNESFVHHTPPDGSTGQEWVTCQAPTGATHGGWAIPIPGTKFCGPNTNTNNGMCNGKYLSNQNTMRALHCYRPTSRCGEGSVFENYASDDYSYDPYDGTPQSYGLSTLPYKCEPRFPCNDRAVVSEYYVRQRTGPLSSCNPGVLEDAQCSAECRSPLYKPDTGKAQPTTATCTETATGYDAAWDTSLECVPKPRCPDVYLAIEAERLNATVASAEGSCRLRSPVCTNCSDHELVGASSWCAGALGTSFSAGRQSLGFHHTVEACAASCHETESCSFFLYGSVRGNDTHPTSGSCWAELGVSNATECGTGNQPEFDLYRAVPGGCSSCSSDVIAGETNGLCTMRCPVGFEKAGGTESLTCLSDGSWNGEMLRCAVVEGSICAEGGTVGDAPRILEKSDGLITDGWPQDADVEGSAATVGDCAVRLSFGPRRVTLIPNWVELRDAADWLKLRDGVRDVVVWAKGATEPSIGYTGHGRNWSKYTSRFPLSDGNYSLELRVSWSTAPPSPPPVGDNGQPLRERGFDISYFAEEPELGKNFSACALENPGQIGRCRETIEHGDSDPGWWRRSARTRTLGDLCTDSNCSCRSLLDAGEAFAGQPERVELSPNSTGPFEYAPKYSCNGAVPIAEVCELQCAPGYNYFSGNALRQCQMNGLWSGEPLWCAPNCPPIALPDNGHTVAVTNATCGGGDLAVHSSICELRCAEETQPDDSGGSKLVQCDPAGNGTWVEAPLSCKPTELCPAAGVLTNSSVSNARLKGGVLVKHGRTLLPLVQAHVLSTGDRSRCSASGAIFRYGCGALSSAVVVSSFTSGYAWDLQARDMALAMPSVRLHYNENVTARFGCTQSNGDINESCDNDGPNWNANHCSDLDGRGSASLSYCQTQNSDVGDVFLEWDLLAPVPIEGLRVHNRNFQTFSYRLGFMQVWVGDDAQSGGWNATGKRLCWEGIMSDDVGFDAMCVQQGAGLGERNFVVGRFVFLLLPSSPQTWDTGVGWRALFLFKAWPIALHLSPERCAQLCEEHPTCKVAAFDTSTGCACEGYADPCGPPYSSAAATALPNGEAQTLAGDVVGGAQWETTRTRPRFGDGYARGGGAFVGQTVEYECLGTSVPIVGNATRTCLPGGTWSGTPLECGPPTASSSCAYSAVSMSMSNHSLALALPTRLSDAYSIPCSFSAARPNERVTGSEISTHPHLVEATAACDEAFACGGITMKDGLFAVMTGSSTVAARTERATAWLVTNVAQCRAPPGWRALRGIRSVCVDTPAAFGVNVSGVSSLRALPSLYSGRDRTGIWVDASSTALWTDYPRGYPDGSVQSRCDYFASSASAALACDAMALDDGNNRPHVHCCGCGHGAGHSPFEQSTGIAGEWAYSRLHSHGGCRDAAGGTSANRVHVGGPHTLDACLAACNAAVEQDAVSCMAVNFDPQSGTCELVRDCRARDQSTTTTVLAYARHVEHGCDAGAAHATLCEAECLPGYERIGGDAERTCVSGSWSGEELRCAPIPRCRSDHLEAAIAERGIVLTESREFYENASRGLTVHVACTSADMHVPVSGEATAICTAVPGTEHGEWHWGGAAGAQPLQCRRIAECPPFEAEAAARLSHATINANFVADEGGRCDINADDDTELLELVGGGVSKGTCLARCSTNANCTAVEWAPDVCRVFGGQCSRVVRETNASDSAWAVVLRHDSSGGKYFARDGWRTNAENPRNATYSVLDELESYRDRGDSRLHFRLVWPQLNASNEWRQSSNPVEPTGVGGAVEGYEAIRVEHDGRAWRGLERSSWDGSDYALLDGSVGINWQTYAVGATRASDEGGISHFTPGESTSLLELYVRTRPVFWRRQPSSRGGFEGQEVSYTCVDPVNYEPVEGDLTRVCLANGTWSGRPTLCAPRSECLESLPSDLSRHTERMPLGDPSACTSGSHMGSSCTLRCKFGFRRESGDYTRTCSGDGTWSGHPLTCASDPTSLCSPSAKFDPAAAIFSDGSGENDPYPTDKERNCTWAVDASCGGGPITVRINMMDVHENLDYLYVFEGLEMDPSKRMVVYRSGLDDEHPGYTGTNTPEWNSVTSLSANVVLHFAIKGGSSRASPSHDGFDAIYFAGSGEYQDCVFANIGNIKVCENAGNGIVEGTEQCDDGNVVPGDGCSPQMMLEIRQCVPQIEYEAVSPEIGCHVHNSSMYVQRDRVCVTMTTCVLGITYQIVSPTDKSDRECGNTTRCDPNTQYEIQPATLLSDRRCDELRVCKGVGIEFEAVAPTWRSNRVCQAVRPECAEVGVEFEAVSPNATHDRVCQVVRPECTGLGTTHFEELVPGTRNDRRCTPYTDCALAYGNSSYELHPGNSSHDRICLTPAPTVAPTPAPSDSPTTKPSESPTTKPSESPSTAPTDHPTVSTFQPSSSPTYNPTTSSPTQHPTTLSPTTSSPTQHPTTSVPTQTPTYNPTISPTHVPTATPTIACAANGVRDRDELGIDCGGGFVTLGDGSIAGCPRCDQGSSCDTFLDCVSGVCVSGLCAEDDTVSLHVTEMGDNLCANQIKDLGEIDIDCGGEVCPRCKVGQYCIFADRDCEVGLQCILGVCAAVTGGSDAAATPGPSVIVFRNGSSTGAASTAMGDVLVAARGRTVLTATTTNSAQLYVAFESADGVVLAASGGGDDGLVLRVAEEEQLGGDAMRNAELRGFAVSETGLVAMLLLDAEGNAHVATYRISDDGGDNTTAQISYVGSVSSSDSSRLSGATALVATGDTLYVVAGEPSNALQVFSVPRDNSSSPELVAEFVQGEDGVSGLQGASSVVTSLDSGLVYVKSANSIGVFSAHNASSFTFVGASGGGNSDASGAFLENAVDVAAFGDYVYVVSSNGTVGAYHVDKDDGGLSFAGSIVVPGATESGAESSTLPVHSRGARSLSVNGVTGRIYVLGDDGVDVFVARNTGGGVGDGGDYDANPGTLIYEGRLEGERGATNEGTSVVVDGGGNVYVLGTTVSEDDSGAVTSGAETTGGSAAVATPGPSVIVFRNDSSTGAASTAMGDVLVAARGRTVLTATTTNSAQLYVAFESADGLVLVVAQASGGGDDGLVLRVAEEEQLGGDAMRNAELRGFAVSETGLVAMLLLDAEGNAHVATYRISDDGGDNTTAQISYVGSVSSSDSSRLSGATALVATGDTLYVVAGEPSNALQVFSVPRDNSSSPELVAEFVQGEDGVSGLQGASSVVLSLDSGLVYVTSTNSIGVFSMNATTTSINVSSNAFIGAVGLGESNSSNSNSSAFLKDAVDVAAFGDYVYVVASDGTVGAYQVDKDDGNLYFAGTIVTPAGSTNESGDDGVESSTLPVRCGGARSISVNENTGHIYVLGDDGVHVFLTPNAGDDNSGGGGDYAGNPGTLIYKERLEGEDGSTTGGTSVVVDNDGNVYVLGRIAPESVVDSNGTATSPHVGGNDTLVDVGDVGSGTSTGGVGVGDTLVDIENSGTGTTGTSGTFSGTSPDSEAALPGGSPCLRWDACLITFTIVRITNAGVCNSEEKVGGSAAPYIPPKTGVYEGDELNVTRLEEIASGLAVSEDTVEEDEDETGAAAIRVLTTSLLLLCAFYALHEGYLYQKRLLKAQRMRAYESIHDTDPLLSENEKGGVGNAPSAQSLLSPGHIVLPVIDEAQVVSNGTSAVQTEEERMCEEDALRCVVELQRWHDDEFGRVVERTSRVADSLSLDASERPEITAQLKRRAEVRRQLRRDDADVRANEGDGGGGSTVGKLMSIVMHVENEQARAEAGMREHFERLRRGHVERGVVKDHTSCGAQIEALFKRSAVPLATDDASAFEADVAAHRAAMSQLHEAEMDTAFDESLPVGLLHFDLRGSISFRHSRNTCMCGVVHQHQATF